MRWGGAGREERRWIFPALETRKCCLGRDRVYTGLGAWWGAPAGLAAAQLLGPAAGQEPEAGMWVLSRGLQPPKRGAGARSPGRAAGIWEHPGCGQTP